MSPNLSTATLAPVVCNSKTDINKTIDQLTNQAASPAADRYDLFPVVDIGYILNNSLENFDEDPRVNKLVDEVASGFKTWGFLYIKGHGIPEHLIAQAFQASESFFQQSSDAKMEFQRSSGISVGYVPTKGEVFDDSKPLDVKEALDFLPKSDLRQKLDTSLPGFSDAPAALYDHCAKLVHKFLRLLARALGLKDTDHFVSQHRNIGQHDRNGTSMRMLYYPDLSNYTLKNDGQMRCGEHTDYGTMTLLFQDDVGGLEVKSPSGQFVKAVPIPGTIVINAADLLHTWSGGEYKATLHRVVPSKSRKRQSIAFFAHPDYDVTINHKDENGNALQRNAHDHLKEMFDRTIKVQEK